MILSTKMSSISQNSPHCKINSFTCRESCSGELNNHLSPETPKLIEPTLQNSILLTEALNIRLQPEKFDVQKMIDEIKIGIIVK